MNEQPQVMPEPMAQAMVERYNLCVCRFDQTYCDHGRRAPRAGQAPCAREAK